MRGEAIEATVTEGNRRVGGRFWALADVAGEEEADDNDLPVTAQPEVASPTSSDVICESFHVGYSQELVAGLVDVVVPQDNPARCGLSEADRVEMVQRVVHRRTAMTAIRPWKGPLPKVRLPKPTLFDFLDVSSWKVVTKKNKRRCSAALLPAPASCTSGLICNQRNERLNFLLGSDGPPSAGPVVGYEAAGYMTQPTAQAAIVIEPTLGRFLCRSRVATARGLSWLGFARKS
ncbi:hypothetical protein ZWY2020_050075 [Hordeum vulgare]|nr:hypothetical protein ZWY2020_050068 [Hordeum vulgare]KAI4976468.1 hypothetical protein ZWY2020_050075 [Hordeum vulgare]